MTDNFQKGLEKKRILSFPEGKKLVSKEIKSAKEDLNEAIDRFKSSKFKYATITAYYSMFHSARALIYSKGYREKSHFYLLVSLESLFVSKGLIDREMISEFHDAMVLREEADYHGQFSKEGSESVINSAKDFINISTKLLKLYEKQ
ncbi:MAG: HEPN domain-containing protein [Endomicrobiales bacterium]|nr:HEPN domain-containing protein [Endomicrobiales bacterium]